MSERRLLSEVPYLGDVDVLPGSRDSVGRFLPEGRARITGRGTRGWQLSYLELTFADPRVRKKSPFRRVSPGLAVCDSGPQDGNS